MKGEVGVGVGGLGAGAGACGLIADRGGWGQGGKSRLVLSYTRPGCWANRERPAYIGGAAPRGVRGVANAIDCCDVIKPSHTKEAHS
jgi:hypothetical protein